MQVEGIVLPGDEIPQEKIPSSQNPNKALTLGPGLRHVPPATIKAVVAGELHIDSRKKAIWVENNGGRYIPTLGDLIIATVHHSSVDYYHCSITPHSPFATLAQLAFEGATKKTRPVLLPGSLVYARVTLADRYMDPELECVQPSTGKAEGLGPLKGGMLFDISLGMARRLLSTNMKEQGLVVLDELAEKIPFEIAVGRNGRLWVDSGSVKTTLAVGRTVKEVDDRGLGIEEQKKLARNMLKGL